MAESVISAYRSLQVGLEREIPPGATSVDGRRFEFIVAVHDLDLRLGGYVVIGAGRLGQLLDLRLEGIEGGTVELPSDEGLTVSGQLRLRVVRGEGVLLGGDWAPFADEPLRPATHVEVRAWLDAAMPARAGLSIGELCLAPGERFSLDAGGFDRHTFLCGQSGSGKTYALGVVLERLLLETDLRMVILDPNSDYVRLASPRDDVDDALAERYRQASQGVVVRSADAEGDARLRLRLPELTADAQAALLRLDPIADRAEYAELAELVAARPETVERLIGAQKPSMDGLVTRIRNLGLDRLGIWAREQGGSVVDDLRSEATRCLEVDLGSLPTPEETALVSLAVLSELWERRAERRPMLIVIDEAHNICPAAPDTPLLEQVTELVVRIAAEGRKFGLYLLVATQRPQKVHENIVTQCDNLLLMRLNSAADAAHAQRTFSFAPQGLVDAAPGFRLGEALVAGKIASHPTLVRVGPRISQEGGADVPATWARAVAETDASG